MSDLVVGGWLIDHLIGRGYEETRVRQGVLVGGMLVGLAVFGATMTANPVWAIVWISLALSGLAAAAPVGWSLPSLIAPRGGTGTIGGIMNFANNVMAIAAPIVTGAIVTATGSFEEAFLVAGIVLLIGILSYVFVLGGWNRCRSRGSECICVRIGKAKGSPSGAIPTSRSRLAGTFGISALRSRQSRSL